MGVMIRQIGMAMVSALVGLFIIGSLLGQQGFSRQISDEINVSIPSQNYASYVDVPAFSEHSGNRSLVLRFCPKDGTVFQSGQIYDRETFFSFFQLLPSEPEEEGFEQLSLVSVSDEEGRSILGSEGDCFSEGEGICFPEAGSYRVEIQLRNGACIRESWVLCVPVEEPLVCMGGTVDFHKRTFLMATAVSEQQIDLYETLIQPPFVEAKDQYYPVGYPITLEQIFSKVRASDAEDGALTWSEEHSPLSIVGYDSTSLSRLFGKMKHGGSVRLSIQAVDSDGLICIRPIHIHLVDTSVYRDTSHWRMIAPEYGTSAAMRIDTLMKRSVWREDLQYRQLLEKVLNNISYHLSSAEAIGVEFNGRVFSDQKKQVEGSGGWKETPICTWDFSLADISGMKEHLDPDAEVYLGYMKTESPEGLQQFYDLYLRQ